MSSRAHGRTDLGYRDPSRQVDYWREATGRQYPGDDVPETLTVRVDGFRLDLADGAKLPPKLVADVLGAKRVGRRRIKAAARFCALGCGGPEAAYHAAMTSGSWAPVVDEPARKPKPEPVVRVYALGPAARPQPAPARVLTAAERRAIRRAERYGYPAPAVA
jgi:hypothetical protein